MNSDMGEKYRDQDKIKEDTRISTMTLTQPPTMEFLKAFKSKENESSIFEQVKSVIMNLVTPITDTVEYQRRSPRSTTNSTEETVYCNDPKITTTPPTKPDISDDTANTRLMERIYKTLLDPPINNELQNRLVVTTVDTKRNELSKLKTEKRNI